MNVFKRVSMKNLDKYVKTPEPFKGIQCQINVTGPQFFEAKGNNKKEAKRS